jgi:hypothetical protein
MAERLPAGRDCGLALHDLRHEAASQWLESKTFELHKVQAMLGHANLSQTNTHLNATIHGLQDAMADFDRACCNPVAIEGNQGLPTDRNDQRGTTALVTVN